jgi:hypothetical protein
MGTANYPLLPMRARLPCVRDDIKLITGLFEELGYESVEIKAANLEPPIPDGDPAQAANPEPPIPNLDPTFEQFRKGLGTWFSSSERKTTDIVVLYYSGHGEPSNPAENHFLLMHDSDQHPGTTAFATADFARFFEDNNVRPPQLLIILDTCYAGLGAEQILDAMKHISRQLTQNKAGIHVVAAALPEEIAKRQSVFAKAFVQAVRKKGEDNPRKPFLDISALISEVNRSLLSQIANHGSKGDRASALFIPNLSQKRQEWKDHLLRVVENDPANIKGWINDFIGRETEIQMISQQIEKLSKTGGYFIIKGHSGQGKSYLMARLIEKYDSESTLFQFVPVNPAREHREKLIKSLIIRLIFKYHLSEEYAEDYFEVSPAELCSRFQKVLATVSIEIGGQPEMKPEIIFLDALNQLPREADGVLDISFLPAEPQRGIVFVLSIREDDMPATPSLSIVPDNIFQKNHCFLLPELSFEDFGEILQRQNISLNQAFMRKLYDLAGQNVLYLGLLTREMRLLTSEMEKLHQPGASGDALSTEFFRRINQYVGIDTSTSDLALSVAQRPLLMNLFALPMVRLQQIPSLWEHTIKPILGLLLVSSEALSERDLADILDMGDGQISSGIKQLGMLIVPDGQQHYALFHEGFQEYLQQNTSQEYLQQNTSYPEKRYIFTTQELADLHQRLLDWCPQDQIWEDAGELSPQQARNRKYAQMHYITHLYFSRKGHELAEWQGLFTFLDEGYYGQAKWRRDRSARAYTQDLDLLLRSPHWVIWIEQDPAISLPRLWQYTLLRHSLAYKADLCPPEVFQLLLREGKVKEALDRAMLLTSPANQIKILLLIAGEIAHKYERWGPQCVQILIRVREITNRTEIEETLENAERDTALSELGTAFAKAHLWEEAQKVILTIDDGIKLAEALCDLSSSLEKAQQKDAALSCLARAEALLQDRKERKQADQALLPEEADQALLAKKASEEKDQVRRKLAQSMLELQGWEQALHAARTIEDSNKKAGAFYELAQHMLTNRQDLKAAEQVIDSIEGPSEKIRALIELATTLFEQSQVQDAQNMYQRIREDVQNIADVLQIPEIIRALGKTLAATQAPVEASLIWDLYENLSGSPADSFHKFQVWRETSKLLIAAKRGDLAQKVGDLAQKTLDALQEPAQRARALPELAKMLTEAGQEQEAWSRWEEIKTLLPQENSNNKRDKALQELSRAYTEVQLYPQARKIAEECENPSLKSEALCVLGCVLVQAGDIPLATQVMDAILDLSMKDKVLFELAKHWAQTANYSESRTIIPSIYDEKKRIEAWGKLGLKVDKEHVQGIREKIEGLVQNKQQRARELVQVGKISAMANKKEQATAFFEQATKLDNTIEKEKAFAEISFYKAWHPLRRESDLPALLSTLQQKLSQVQTRRDTIEMLTDMYELVQWKPEIGDFLWKAFYWVDAFLAEKHRIQDFLQADLLMR